MKENDLYYLAEKGYLSFQSEKFRYLDHEIKVHSNIRTIGNLEKIISRHNSPKDRAIIKEAFFLFYEPEKGVGEESYLMTFDITTDPVRARKIARKLLPQNNIQVTENGHRCYDSDGFFQYEEVSTLFIRYTFKKSVTNEVQLA